MLHNRITRDEDQKYLVPHNIQYTVCDIQYIGFFKTYTKITMTSNRQCDDPTYTRVKTSQVLTKSYFCNNFCSDHDGL